MELKTDIGVTPGMKMLFDRLDEILPTGEKTEDFFKAFAQDITDFIRSADSVGIDGMDLLGDGIKITMSCNPTTPLEGAQLNFKKFIAGRTTL